MLVWVQREELSIEIHSGAQERTGIPFLSCRSKEIASVLMWSFLINRLILHSFAWTQSTYREETWRNLTQADQSTEKTLKCGQCLLQHEKDINITTLIQFYHIRSGKGHWSGLHCRHTEADHRPSAVFV